jgi:hypothetical protein
MGFFVYRLISKLVERGAGGGGLEWDIICKTVGGGVTLCIV